MIVLPSSFTSIVLVLESLFFHSDKGAVPSSTPFLLQ